MRRSALAVIALLLSGCTADLDSFDTVQSAGWEAGYRFHYSLEGSVSVQSHYQEEGEDPEDVDETITLAPTPYLVEEVLTTQLEADGEPIYVTLETILDDINEALAEQLDEDVAEEFGEDSAYSSVSAFRQRDFIPVGMASSYDGFDGSMTATSVEFYDNSDPAYEHPPIMFPLSPGMSWGKRMEFPIDEDLGLDIVIETTADVRGASQVEGPDGSISAIRIDHTVRLANGASLAAAAEAALREEGLEDVRVTLGMAFQGSLYWSPELRTFVRAELSGGLHGSMSAAYEGDAFEASGSAQVDLRMQLTDASYAITSDRGAAAVLDALERELEGAPPLPPTARVLDRPSQGLVTVSASHQAVNAADGTTVTFTASLDDSAAGTVTLELVDADGASLATAAGDSLSAPITRSGPYYAIAELRDDDGRLVDAAYTEVLASWDSVVPLACMPVAANLVTPCDDATFRPGPGSGPMTATLQVSPLVPVTGGQFVLRNAQGAAVASQAVSGTTTLTYQADLGEDLGADWAASYEPVANVVPSGSITLHVEPTPAASIDSVTITAGGNRLLPQMIPGLGGLLQPGELVEAAHGAGLLGVGPLASLVAPKA